MLKKYGRNVCHRLIICMITSIRYFLNFVWLMTITSYNVKKLLNLRRAVNFFHVCFKSLNILNFFNDFIILLNKGLYQTYLINERIEKSSIKYCEFKPRFK
jgi:hypothetical protein